MTLPIAEIEVDLDYGTVQVTVDSPGVEFGVPGLTGKAGRSPIVFGTAGPVIPKVGTFGFWPRVNGKITRVTAAVTTQTSGVTIPDVNISGATIFTNQAHRPTLSGVGRHFDDADAIDAGVFTATDYISCDIDQVGVGVTDLIVTVDYEET